ncbi:MAG: hypothetical protein HUU01_16335, partial [Saprospiraceae bacterium]|nr:hypothetical protein [Saprospiraceae bacterium]
PSGALTLETSQRISQQTDEIRHALRELGFASETLEEEVRNYSQYLRPAQAAAVMTAGTKQQLKREQNILREIRAGTSTAESQKQLGYSLIRTGNGDGNVDREYATIPFENDIKTWVLDQSGILRRATGAAGLKMLEAGWNGRCAQRSTPETVFARVNSFQKTDKTITITYGSKQHNLAAGNLLKLINGEITAPTSDILEFYKELNTMAVPDVKVVFVFDEWLDGRQLSGANGMEAIVPDVFPGADLINPHKLAATLARYQPESAQGRLVQFGICRSDMALALNNASRSTTVHGVRDFGLVVQKDGYLSDDQPVVAHLQKAFGKIDGKVFDLGGDLAFEGGNFILIAGRKTPEFRAQLTEAAKRHRFKDKNIILISCYEHFSQNEIEFNSRELLLEGEAASVYLQDFQINLYQQHYILLEFFKNIDRLKTGKDIRKILDESIDEAIRKKKDLKKELNQFRKGIFQYSSVDEIETTKQSG